ncbi:MAG: penicillin-binding protein 1C [Flavobacteriales bacterium]|jgi:penicillin-binding protein 1C|nr:penicillin-binding protein 1C [Flavobacteriales bacterium]
MKFSPFKYLKKHKKKSLVFLVLLVWYYFSLPNQLFVDPTSTVLESREGVLLGAKIADDGQWRFPHNDSVPEKFKTCILQFEDAYFYSHPGINPVSIVKAIGQNLQSNKVRRGGSTITQQVIRLARKGRSRTYFEKVIEMILATRLELRSSKDQILAMYASNAPFGGNVVGLDVASWRYFNCKPDQLSWAESATLAVLPNAPSLIYPGKNQEKLIAKRNRLLKKLYQNQLIDSLTFELALLEELPPRPYSIPQIAPHLLIRLDKSYHGKRIQTTIKASVQRDVNQIVEETYLNLSQNHIYNAAVLVLDVHSRAVLAYVGNTPTNKEHQKDVDIVTKPRSTGSILKPFLYAAMLDQGALLPHQLIPDVPTQIANYNPQNFDKHYDGAVPASAALYRSLNIPAVRMLQQFGVEKFYHYLTKMKLKDIRFAPDHYGLSLILGGAESNLWDITKNYAAFASTVNHYRELESNYYTNEFTEPNMIAEKTVDFGAVTHEKPLFDAGAIYLTLETLTKVNRPMGEENWEFYSSGQKIAWKTGTSFGFRDAWAVGTTKDYTVGVWIGNADGEGRTGLVGVQAAAPVLFSVFEQLPKADWFKVPYDELVTVTTCAKSGMLAGDFCEELDTLLVPRAGKRTTTCKYHRWVHLDQDKSFQVDNSCYDLELMQHQSWFVLPPLMEYYYQQKDPTYKVLPPFRMDCQSSGETKMEFIFPKPNTKLYLPKGFDEKVNDLVLKVAHSSPNVTLFWYLDDEYLGETKEIHEIAVMPSVGKHLITVVDEQGNELKQWTEISE